MLRTIEGQLQFRLGPRIKSITELNGIEYQIPLPGKFEISTVIKSESKSRIKSNSGKMKSTTEEPVCKINKKYKYIKNF